MCRSPSFSTAKHVSGTNYLEFVWDVCTGSIKIVWTFTNITIIIIVVILYLEVLRLPSDNDAIKLLIVSY